MGMELLGGHQPISYGHGLHQGTIHRLGNLAGFIAVVCRCRAVIELCMGRRPARTKRRPPWTGLGIFFRPDKTLPFRLRLPGVALLENFQRNPKGCMRNVIPHTWGI